MNEVNKQVVKDLEDSSSIVKSILESYEQQIKEKNEMINEMAKKIRKYEKKPSHFSNVVGNEMSSK